MHVGPVILGEMVTAAVGCCKGKLSDIGRYMWHIDAQRWALAAFSWCALLCAGVRVHGALAGPLVFTELSLLVWKVGVITPGSFPGPAV